MTLTDPSTRIAVAAFLHDIGKLAERAGIDHAGRLDAHKTLYCPRHIEGSYAKGRKLVDATFDYWLRTCVAATKSAAGLDHFSVHFEAVVIERESFFLEKWHEYFPH